LPGHVTVGETSSATVVVVVGMISPMQSLKGGSLSFHVDPGGGQGTRFGVDVVVGTVVVVGGLTR
jgi:hypothetical protein